MGERSVSHNLQTSFDNVIKCRSNCRSAFFMPFFTSSAHAATAVAKGPYTWKDPHGVAHETAFIKIGDNIVFCIDPGKPAPYGGHSYALPKRQYDDGVKAILYYGFGGDGNEIGNSMTDMVKTYVALNNWLDGKRTQKRIAT